MRSSLAILIVTLVALLCPSVALGNVIVNGDFEANFNPQYFGYVQVGGPIDGWTLSSGPGEICWGAPCFGLRQSAAEAWLQPARGVVAWIGDVDDYIAQDVPTTPGASYVFSAWLLNLSGGAPNTFEFWWNGTLIDSLSDADSFGWTQFSYAVTATGSSTAVRLGGSNLPGVWALDGVTVDQTPEPTSVLLCGAALAALAAAKLRRRYRPSRDQI